MAKNPQTKNRIHFLDEMRGLAVFCIFASGASYTCVENNSVCRGAGYVNFAVFKPK